MEEMKSWEQVQVVLQRESRRSILHKRLLLENGSMDCLVLILGIMHIIKEFRRQGLVDRHGQPPRLDVIVDKGQNLSVFRENQFCMVRKVDLMNKKSVQNLIC